MSLLKLILLRVPCRACQKGLTTQTFPLSPQSPKGQLAAWSNKMSFLFRAEEKIHF
ncbi:LOW QUALITY PROTEIN: GLIPR1L1 isoform 3 [Pongo abelii]|uniref:GLIPR1L1 isoform 3 n=1 Tax=Pongo abelii TaxID=9601 RepID=A0A2J8W1E8_PONAB|nr:LOW QUALITY PROTEIN: GLIPR1L1 isoform 3 [Pongo abelii]